MPSILNIRNPKCDYCELCSGARTICVPGKGNAKAKLMLIGEAPGEDEDRKGIPFVGAAGKRLDSVTQVLQLNDTYTTNVVKCHPLFNAKPTANQISTCSSEYLAKEIELVKPELIVCLGRIPGNTLLCDTTRKVEEMRNTIWYTQGPMPRGIPFIVTYHPAATLYNEDLLRFIVQDFEWVTRILSGENSKVLKTKQEYTKIDSIYDIPDIKEAMWLDLDLETDGIDAFHPKKEILSLQISIAKGKAYYLDWTDEVSADLNRFLNHTDGVSINGHYIKYDLKWLRTKAGIVFKGRINDTAQDLHLIDETFPARGLDVVSAAWTELKGHKDEFKKLINIYVKMHKGKKEPITQARRRLWREAFYSIPIEKRIAYGCGDADATGRLRRRFRKHIKELGLQPLHKLMCNATAMYVDMECNGNKIDEPLLPVLARKYRRRLARYKGELDTLAGIDMNHNAWQQLQNLIYGRWKLPSFRVKVGKKWSNYSTSKDALELILGQVDLKDRHRSYLDTLLKYRKINKLYGTYVLGMPRYLRDGYVHPTWRLDGAETGRSSCTDPAWQTVPRKGDIKALVVSRFEDGILVQIDVSQGELRIAAQESRESNLIRMFNDGTHDIHTMTAASALHKLPEDVTEEERYIYKTVNFLILYGGGISTLAQEIKKPEDVAAKILYRWHKTFPGWKPHVDKVMDYVIANGHIRSIFGRYRHISIGDPKSPQGRDALRAAVNSPIQGGLRDYVVLAGYNLWKRVFSPEVLFINETHDSWLIDTRKIHVKRVIQAAKEEFENVDTSEFGFKFVIPMRIDIKTGPNWRDVK